ncbi:hypothetical protein Bbelb_409330 [Branchiostoma belcheri]|nr:hypothetical protein Bbelb_409330 [Branchiostoma belcheri]
MSEVYWRDKKNQRPGLLDRRALTERIKGKAGKPWRNLASGIILTEEYKLQDQECYYVSIALAARPSYASGISRSPPARPGVFYRSPLPHPSLKAPARRCTRRPARRNSLGRLLRYVLQRASRKNVARTQDLGISVSPFRPAPWTRFVSGKRQRV